tara:strand:- start:16 stop:354 length:339 start_codon:yes stop_codon:yes gene_type:complete
MGATKMANYKYKNLNGEKVELTAEEITALKARDTAWKSKSGDRKLEIIRQLRNKKLQETDYFALSDTTLTQAMSDYRQGLRDIPQNNTTEAKYDLLLVKVDKKLTHAIWSKP